MEDEFEIYSPMQQLWFIDDNIVVGIVSTDFNFGAFNIGRCCGTTVFRIQITVMRWIIIVERLFLIVWGVFEALFKVFLQFFMRFQVHWTKFVDVNQFIGTRWAQWQFVICLWIINLYWNSKPTTNKNVQEIKWYSKCNTQKKKQYVL